MSSVDSFAVLKQGDGSLTLTWNLIVAEGLSVTHQQIYIDSITAGVALRAVNVDKDATQKTLTVAEHGLVPNTRELQIDQGITTIIEGTALQNFILSVSLSDGSSIQSDTLIANVYQSATPSYDVVSMDRAIRVTINDILDQVALNSNFENMPAGALVKHVLVTLVTNDPNGTVSLKRHRLPVLESTDPNADATKHVLGTKGQNDWFFVLGLNGIGQPLINLQNHELAIQYEISDDATIDVITDTTYAQDVIPSLIPTEPRGLCTQRPSGDHADDQSVEIMFQAPANDINPNDPTNDDVEGTTMNYYELWRTESIDAVTAPAVDASGVVDSDWTKVLVVKQLHASTTLVGGEPVLDVAGGDVKNITDGEIDATKAYDAVEAIEQAAVYSVIEGGLESGKRYWYSVRAVRHQLDDEPDAVPSTTDDLIPGAFCAPVDAVIFNYTDVAGPTLTASTTIDVAAINVDFVYPSNATTTDEVIVGEDYSAVLIAAIGSSELETDVEEPEVPEIPANADTISGSDLKTLAGDNSYSYYKLTSAAATVLPDDRSYQMDTNFGRRNVVFGSSGGIGWYDVSGIDNTDVFVRNNPAVPKVPASFKTANAVNFTGLTNGETYTVDKGLYKQTYKTIDVTAYDATDKNAERLAKGDPVEYESADSGASGSTLINDAASKDLTPFTSLLALDDISSTALDGKLPLGGADGQKLNVTWTPYADYDNGSRFFSMIKYEILYEMPGLSEGDPNVEYTKEISSYTTNEDQTTLITDGLENGEPVLKMRLRAYFNNDEMSNLLVEKESAENTTNVIPFAYPEAVTGLTLNQSGEATWTAGDDNGAGACTEVNVRFKYDFTEGVIEEGVTSDAEAAITNASDFALGKVLSVAVTGGYIVASDTDTIGNFQSDADAVNAHDLRPLAPRNIASTPGNQTLDITWDEGDNNAKMALNSDGFTAVLKLGSDTIQSSDLNAGSKDYSGLVNGSAYKIELTATYTYEDTERTSGVAELEGEDDSELSMIPFHTPIFTAANISWDDTVAGNIDGVDYAGALTIVCDNNGRKLREAIIVGIPDNNDAASYFDVIVRNAGATALSADNVGANDAESHTATFYLIEEPAQALVALENAAGNTVVLKDMSS